MTLLFLVENRAAQQCDRQRGDQHNGRHLLGLINAVLDLSKIEAGQLTLALGDYTMKELVYGAVTAVESLAAENRLALEVELAREEIQRVARGAAAEAAMLVIASIVATIGLGMLCVSAVVAADAIIDSLAIRLLVMTVIYMVLGGLVARYAFSRIAHTLHTGSVAGQKVTSSPHATHRPSTHAGRGGSAAAQSSEDSQSTIVGSGMQALRSTSQMSPGRVHGNVIPEGAPPAAQCASSRQQKLGSRS